MNIVTKHNVLNNLQKKDQYRISGTLYISQYDSPIAGFYFGSIPYSGTSLYKAWCDVFKIGQGYALIDPSEFGVGTISTEYEDIEFTIANDTSYSWAMIGPVQTTIGLGIELANGAIRGGAMLQHRFSNMTDPVASLNEILRDATWEKI